MEPKDIPEEIIYKADRRRPDAVDALFALSRSIDMLAVAVERISEEVEKYRQFLEDEAHR